MPIAFIKKASLTYVALLFAVPGFSLASEEFPSRIVVQPQDGLVTGSVLKVLNRVASSELRLDRVLSDGSLVLRVPFVRAASDLDALVARLAFDPMVKSVSRSGWLVPEEFNDPGYAGQRSLYASSGSVYNSGIEESSARYSGAGSDVVVAVVDTGLAEVSDLEGKIVGQANFYDEGSFSSALEPNTESFECRKSGRPIFHGTAVASLISARSNNGLGVVGVSESTGILSIRAVGDCGGDDIHTVEAIRWAAGVDMRSSGYPLNPTPAKIINVSLGSVDGSGFCPAHMQRAIDDAKSKGAIVVSSAGNAASRAQPYPAACRGVIAVGSASPDGSLSSYSNFVPVPLMISAPGGDKGRNQSVGDPLSEQQFRQARGTSYATAVVSGLLSKAVSIAGYANAAELHASMTRSGFLLTNEARCQGSCGYAINAPAFLQDVSASATGNNNGLLEREITSRDLGFKVLSAASWVDPRDFDVSSSRGRSFNFTEGGSALVVTVPQDYRSVLKISGMDDLGQSKEAQFSVASTDKAVLISQEASNQPSQTVSVEQNGGGGSLTLPSMALLFVLFFLLKGRRTAKPKTYFLNRVATTKESS